MSAVLSEQYVATGLDACHKRIAELEAILAECADFIEPYIDVVDGDYGVPAPNRAMHLHSEIEQALGS